jgi:hypothetical protein
MEAIMFCDCFQGRWMKGEGFYHPETPCESPAGEGAARLGAIEVSRVAIALRNIRLG